MPYNDNDNIKDKKKPGFNAQAFKHAIGMVESAGGKYLTNSSSSASGKYHFLYNLIQNDPDMAGVSQIEFLNRPELQEKIMNKALEGRLKGFTYGQPYAEKLKRNYNSNLAVEDIAALIHFMGAGGARSYLRDPSNYKVKGKNLTPEQYVERFHNYYKQYEIDNPAEEVKEEIKDPEMGPIFYEDEENPISYVRPEEFADNPVPKPEEDPIGRMFEIDDYILDNSSSLTQPEKKQLPRERNIVQQDNTRVAQPKQPKFQGIEMSGQQQMMEQLLAKLPEDVSSYQARQEELNNFKEGGQLTGTNGVDKLVTLFEAGGTHEENPLGGIPQGMGANGKPNLVEEGETKFKDYIFSNSISLDGTFTSKDGKKSNIFNNGGKLTDPTEGEKKTTEETTPDYGPVAPEGLNYPLKITKTKSKFHTKGADMYIDDNRGKYLGSQNPLSLNQVGDDEVDWSRLNTDENTDALIKRYNDPWSREKLREQTGYSDYDIDNMLVRALEAKEQHGGNVSGSKASYNRDKNIISTGHDHVGDTSVNMHERIHASGLDKLQGMNLVEILGNSFQQKNKSFLQKMSPGTARYLNQPHEAYGNFVEFREKLGLKPGEQINLEELKKRVKKNNLNMENFYRAFDDDRILEALNTIAYEGNNNMDSYTLA